ncbi:MAG: hypothetical protein WD607_11265 [Candidatus Paceibacterota bacterium]
MSNKKKNKKIGILNKGKSNKFINNIFENFDVGIQDEGEDTFAKGNKFKEKNNKIENKWWEKTWIQIILIMGSIAGIIGFLFLINIF